MFPIDSTWAVPRVLSIVTADILETCPTTKWRAQTRKLMLFDAQEVCAGGNAKRDARDQPSPTSETACTRKIKEPEIGRMIPVDLEEMGSSGKYMWIIYLRLMATSRIILADLDILCFYLGLDPGILQVLTFVSMQSLCDVGFWTTTGNGGMDGSEEGRRERLLSQQAIVRR